ncbi:MAG: glycosyltransferase [Planctomycetia bacterium]|jgi:glycosyltransferase involved in cell wall biosynthesis
MSAKSVLSICLDDSPVLGGLSRGIRDMADALGGQILSLDSGRLPPSQDDARWNIRRVDVGRGLLASRHLRLRQPVAAAIDAAIAQSSLVVCHSLYRAHLPFIRRSCLRHGVPYWVVAHGMLDPWVVSRHAGWKRAWLMLVGKRCLADAERVIFNTEAERAKASPWCRPGNALVIPWPVDLPDVSDRARCRAELRRQLGIPTTDRILLSLARYDSLKRPLHTVAAFAAASQPGWHLVMAGYDGDLTREAVEQAARLQADASIRVLGPVEGEAKPQLLMASDAFVSLSWRENFGYSLADSAAHGLCGAYAPDHDLVADMPEQCRRWVAGDHSLCEARRMLHAMLTTASTIREESGHVGQVWAKDRLARGRFKEVVRQEAALRLQES